MAPEMDSPFLLQFLLQKKMLIYFVVVVLMKAEFGTELGGLKVAFHFNI